MKVRIKKCPDGASIAGADKIVPLWGGQAKQLSDNPVDGGVTHFTGQSHDTSTNGLSGIGINFGGNQVEVEGGESATKSPDGSINIWGAMKVPGSTTTFKRAIQKIADEENKATKEKNKGTKLQENSSVATPYGAIGYNTSKVLLDSAAQKHEGLAAEKEHLANVQNELLALSDTLGVEPQKLSSKLREGGKIPQAGDGKNLKSKYDAVKQETEDKLRALYPNSDIKVVQTGDRDIRDQRGLKGAGKSKTSVSLHNFGGANDHLIYIDGKLINDPSVYKNTLWKAAADNGMYTIGSWDPGHISAVKEGSGHTLADLMKAYPELKGTDRYNNSLSYLQQAVVNGTADRQETYAYNQLTGASLKGGRRNPKYNGVTGDYMGETPLAQRETPSPVPVLPLAGDHPVSTASPDVAPQPISPSGGGVYGFNPAGKKKLPSLADRNKLGITDFLGEIAGVAEQPDSVAHQHFTPTYYSPYSVSFQDRLNANNSSFKNVADQLVNNPEALSSLAAQKYEADNSVLGDQFRTNQGIANDITNKNVGLENQASQINLGLQGQQYEREAIARSNTRAHNLQAISSISNKIAQNRADNVDIRLRENLSGYRPDENYNLQWMGGDHTFTDNGGGMPNPELKTKTIVDNEGNRKTITTYDPKEIQAVQNANKVGFKRLRK